MATNETKTMTVHVTWRSTQEVEVPDDYEFNGGLDDEWVGQVDINCAEMVDWDLTEEP